MPRGQRIAFLAIAAVIAMVAVVVAIAAGGDDEEDPAQTAPGTTPTREPPLLTANSGKTVRAKKGGEVLFRVRSKTVDELHVHGYDLVRPLAPGLTLTVRFRAHLEGVYEIELERSHTPLGELEVRP